MGKVRTSYARADDVQKVTMHSSISESQVIFCGCANHKQYYEARTSLTFRLLVLKRIYNIIIDCRGNQ